MMNYSKLSADSQISPRTKKKFALIVGFEYPKDKHNPPITGPALSSENFKQLLIDYFGFLPANITHITDEGCSHTPTDEKILKELIVMVKKAKPRDTVVFLFCGHGGRYKGNYNNDSGFVEFLSTGTRPDGTQTYIRDYTLRQIVETVSKFISFTIIADTCHSGGLLEGANEVIGNSINNSITNKTQPPRNPFLNLGNPTGRPLGVLISACQSDENTGTIFCALKHKPVCRFTNTLIVVVKRFGVNLSYQTLVQEIRKVFISEGHYFQHPGLYCDQTQMNLGFLSLGEVVTDQVDSAPPTSQANRSFLDEHNTLNFDMYELFFKKVETCEDFYAALQDAEGHAETAVVKLNTSYNPEEHVFSLKISQEIPPTAGQSVKKPMFIPIAIGLTDSTGKDIPLSSICHDGALQSVSSNDQPLSATILRVTKGIDHIINSAAKSNYMAAAGVGAEPSHGYASWYGSCILFPTAGQSVKKPMFILCCKGAGTIPGTGAGAGTGYGISQKTKKEEFVFTDIAPIRPEADNFNGLWQRHIPSDSSLDKVNGNIGEYAFDLSNMARQALKNGDLAYLASIEDQEFTNCALQTFYRSLLEYKTAKNMTEQFAALTFVAQNPGKTHDYAPAVFNDKWQNDYLVNPAVFDDKWQNDYLGIDHIINSAAKSNYMAAAGVGAEPSHGYASWYGSCILFPTAGQSVKKPMFILCCTGAGTVPGTGTGTGYGISQKTKGIDHIINSTAKSNYMAAAGVGAEHSHGYASWYGSCLVLKVLAPHSSKDARGLLKASTRLPDPVVFLENELLYGESFTVSAEVLDSCFCPPIGKEKIEREGQDVTVTALSKMVAFALKAAETLVKEGISAEVINASVRETNSLLTVEEGLAVPQIEDIVRSAKRACHRSVPIAATA